MAKKDDQALANYDDVIQKISSYVCRPIKFASTTFENALLCLADSIGCALLALNIPACVKLVGPLFPGEKDQKGGRVIGTSYTLDPMMAAFNTSLMIRWLDFNDTWLAAEWGHPSDNIGALLPLADYQCNVFKKKITLKDLLEMIIKAYEIQGILALSNSLNRVGFDHVLFVKAATVATACRLLGGREVDVAAALSHAFIDTGPLRTYRHQPSVGSRKSWAAADAAARGIYLAVQVLKGEAGYPKALSATKWGFNEVILKGRPLNLERPLESYVIDNILFKVLYPAEFHAQTALEAAIKLHPSVKDKWMQIERIDIETHDSAIRIIDKQGPLTCPADRDHCLQYIVAIGLLKGDLKEHDYEEKASKNPLIDFLREKMQIREHPGYTQDYLDPEKRSIASAIQIHFKNGDVSPRVEVEYPLGHQRRRTEAKPFLFKKFEHNLSTRFNQNKVKSILSLFQNEKTLLKMPVNSFIEQFLP